MLKDYHLTCTFYFKKKNNLKLGLEEQHAIDQISSPKQLLLDYYKKGKYIAVKYNVWKVEKNHISNEIMKNIGPRSNIRSDG